ncbi:MAG: FtsX-like permease family protein [Rhizobiaceae bacterium]
MRVLDRKIARDIRRLWAQVIAVALVMACGVATIVLAVGAYRSLEETRNAFYERQNFADIFATATRAPMRLSRQIEAIPGVAAADYRISQAVVLDMEGMKEPASGVVISIPATGESRLNKPYLRLGRLPGLGRADEVAVAEKFAEAHSLEPGDGFHALINGKRRLLKVTGIVLSPEFIYALAPGDIMPDERRFGVIFMTRPVLEGIFDMDGGFNSLAVTLHAGASAPAVVDALDRLLKPYGSRGAIERKDQVSNAFLDNELQQLRSMALVIPPIFLFVSAFLVNMILSRLISLEREQIGLFKAIGYGEAAIAVHYAKLVLVIAAIGLLIGAVAGAWLGRGLTRMYGDFFSFPYLIFRQSLDLYALAGGITALAALAGAARAIWSVVILPPAVAMRPAAPMRYHRLLGEAGARLNLFSQTTTMALRHLVRRPVRTMITALGTSFSVAILTTALFMFDSMDVMIDTVFFQAERQDATVAFATERSRDVLTDLTALPGVMRAEPFRVTPVKMTNGHRSLKLDITALPRDGDLGRVLSADGTPVRLPRGGLLVPRRVASKLALRVGDKVSVELLLHDGRTTDVPVVGVIQSLIGLGAFMELDALNRLIGDGRRISGARLAVDTDRIDDIYAEIKTTPAIASFSFLGATREKFSEIIEENITIMASVYVGLAVIITFGVVYNSARIQLAERARELASLRVLGFTRAEVSSVLLTELGVIIAIAQPLGWLLGYGFAWSVIHGFESDLFRIPFVVEPATFARASLVVVLAGIITALVARRRIDRFDLVSVLKTRE